MTPPDLADLIRTRRPFHDGVQLARVDRFLEANPNASFTSGTGFKQMHLTWPSGSDTITRRTLRELMDEVDARYPHPAAGS